MLAILLTALVTVAVIMGGADATWYYINPGLNLGLTGRLASYLKGNR